MFSKVPEQGTADLRRPTVDSVPDTYYAALKGEAAPPIQLEAGAVDDSVIF
jgi:hypothetical protein